MIFALQGLFNNMAADSESLSNPTLVAAEVVAKGAVASGAVAKAEDTAAAKIQAVARNWRYHATWLFLSVGVGMFAVLMSVHDNRENVALPLLGNLPELCMLKAQTGLSCPGCGLTRCFISLAHGDLNAAWDYNPAGLIVFAVLAYQIPYRLIALGCIASGRRFVPHSAKVSSVAVFAIVGGLIAQWFLRLVFFGI